jgi:hypothetical protein
VAAAFEVLVPDQPEICLVNEGGGVQGVARFLLGHPCLGKLPQFVVDEREQISGCQAVAGRSGIQEA